MSPSALFDEQAGSILTGLDVRPISIVMPVHNEALSIESVVRGFVEGITSQTGGEVIICEDGSTDGTREILERIALTLPIRLVTDPERLGYADAVRKGLLLAENDVIFFSDSDGQYHRDDFWRLSEWIDGLDMVIGWKVRRKEPLHRIVLARGFHLLVKVLFGIGLQDIDCGFRILRTRVARDLVGRVSDLPYSFWAEFTILARIRGYRIAEVPISHRDRVHGTTTIYRPRDLPWIILRQWRGLLKLRARLSEEIASQEA